MIEMLTALAVLELSPGAVLTSVQEPSPVADASSR